MGKIEIPQECVDIMAQFPFLVLPSCRTRSPICRKMASCLVNNARKSSRKVHFKYLKNCPLSRNFNVTVSGGESSAVCVHALSEWIERILSVVGVVFSGNGRACIRESSADF